MIEERKRKVSRNDRKSKVRYLNVRAYLTVCIKSIIVRERIQDNPERVHGKFKFF